MKTVVSMCGTRSYARQSVVVENNRSRHPRSGERSYSVSGCLQHVVPLLLVSLLLGVLPANAAEVDSGSVRSHIPTLLTDNTTLNRAYRIAVGDLQGNVAPYKAGLLESPRPCILAGLDYGTPWTRDAAINASNGASLLLPRVARDTLLSVLTRVDGELRIGGQYWDSIVWTTGAWSHYLYTDDRAFLAAAFEATRNTLAHLEKTEFDAERNLFRGPGWSDGVAGYPDAYGDSAGSSSILDWPKCNPDKISKPGYGIPMMALSTNCLYYNAYVLLGRMAEELDAPVDSRWQAKADKLREAINTHLWNEAEGRYRFLVGPLGDCDHEEGLGLAYAILFGVANADRIESTLTNTHVTPAGLPCEWPSYTRYDSPDGTAVARHAGTVWPQIQGFWAEACARHGKTGAFAHEFFNLAEHAERDRQFAEIYHPATGEIYGGMQEATGKGVILWDATSRQSWAATAYLRMTLLGLVGLRFETDGVRFAPCLPEGVTYVEMRGLKYRRTTLDIIIGGGPGSRVRECRLDGKLREDLLLDGRSLQRHEVLLMMAPPS